MAQDELRRAGSGRRGGVRPWRAVVAGVLAILLLALLPGLVRLANFGERVEQGKLAESRLGPFYAASTAAPGGAPGDIVRSEPMVGAPPGAEAWRVIYRSSDEEGQPTVVSGTVVAPTTVPTSDRTVVAWGHPTTGTASRCAPSIGMAPFVLIEGLGRLLSAGYVVVATDYSGMGMPGPPSFLLGATEAANVLDIVRVAGQIPDAHASNDLILWGHSQGGHAALFAAQRAATYAPDLNLLGVAVAAPATDLAALLQADIVDVSGITIGAYALTAYASAYAGSLPPDPLSSILTSDGVSAAGRMSELCLLGQNNQLHAIARPLLGRFLAREPATTAPWDELLAQNKPHAGPLPVPLFVAQGESDTLVRPEVTAAFVLAQQAAGTAVTSHTYPRIGHGTVALVAIDDLLPWMSRLRS
ncbi:pimeloyl-ACP methyl ester carboxylesterase [Okibacterium sp. HSC-33S16]|uniref:alpha/beta fold hydrolase n=1 Tax=Okibacterium sp. HSC-33S16 TaxID=2910965 RepID=UPI00209E42B7|nr:lipase family protein [Okibacterium sp. HSC-33S16]MCP2032651.1 pimeloyl-ACP methyl ester carboxylesterase [Okibacterium sp. HSC-33S16]